MSDEFCEPWLLSYGDERVTARLVQHASGAWRLRFDGDVPCSVFTDEQVFRGSVRLLANEARRRNEAIVHPHVIRNNNHER